MKTEEGEETVSTQATIIPKRERLDSLQALRTIAFLGIFFDHAVFIVKWPALGVSVFYVMSGFLMMYRYKEKTLNVSFRDNAWFSIKRIGKLYPLHIITMLATLLLLFTRMILGGITVKSLVKMLIETVMNVTLLQTWIPNHNMNISLNGVAWYLSVTAFLYFVFPFLHSFIKKNRLSLLSVISVIILCTEVVLCIPFLKIFGNSSPVYIWFMYCFPVFRVGEFFIGGVLEKLYSGIDQSKIDRVKASVFEIVATVVTVVAYMWIGSPKNSVLLQAACNWTTMYIPLAALWVIIFALNKGIITKLFVNKLFVYIGNISAYAFLIHFVITQYVANFIDHFHLSVSSRQRLILVVFELFATILVSIAYKYIDQSSWFKHICSKIGIQKCYR